MFNSFFNYPLYILFLRFNENIFFSCYLLNSLASVPPKIAPFDFGDDPLNYGEPASVQCTILDGDLPINVEWMLNDRSAQELHDISIVKLGKRVTALTIDSVAGHHRGNYSCRAMNRAGTVEQSATLFVNGLLRKSLC